jgi:hypothetical protein
MLAKMKTEPTQEMEKDCVLHLHKSIIGYNSLICNSRIVFGGGGGGGGGWDGRWEGCSNFVALNDYILDIELGIPMSSFSFFLFAFEDRTKNSQFFIKKC